MSKKNITSFKLNTKRLPKLTRAQKKRLDTLSDATIDYSDIPPLDAKFWHNLEVARGSEKRATGIRLDTDVLDWFKKNGRGYQSHINAVLRAYVFSQPGVR